MSETAAPLRILVAEDVETNAVLIGAILGAAGHRFEIVGDGLAVVAAAADPQWNLILMDLQLPLLSGLDATRRIRAAEGDGPRRPIVAITALTAAEDAARCHAAGMDAHLGKPIRPAMLLAAIERLAGRGRMPLPQSIDREDLEALAAILGTGQLLGYVDRCRAALQDRVAALATASPGELRVLVHDLTSLAAQIGCRDLAARIKALGEAARHAPEAVASLMPEIESARHRADSEIGRVLEEMTGLPGRPSPSR